MLQLPPLYAIMDKAFFPSSAELLAFAGELVAGGCKLLQYRNKSGNARVMLEQARELRRLFPAHTGVEGAAENGALRQAQGRPLEWATHPVRLMMNDRADLCLAAGFDGVHVGQEDLSPEAVREIIGVGHWLGVSTHNPEQLREADLTSADYLAIGPVFATSSKDKPDPVVGLEGVRRARALTRKPLVAIGGITRANAASVIEAGADSVAVISDLLWEPRKSAEEFLRVLR
jgi:thiamine-phosphate pyrophosphorylase